MFAFKESDTEALRIANELDNVASDREDKMRLNEINGSYSKQDRDLLFSLLGSMVLGGNNE